MTAYLDEVPGGGLLAVVYRRSWLAGIGLVALALLVALTGLSIAAFTHAFADQASVTLDLPRAGSQLSPGADIKLHGIIVGRVAGISADADGGGARLTLALDRDQLHLIPRNVTAQVIPKTLFGEKYVALTLPKDSSRERLAGGDTIAADRSSVSIETSTVLNNLEPLLVAVSPADLDKTLTSMAAAFAGRGKALGATIDAGARYAHQLQGEVKSFLADSGLFAVTADSYTAAAPNLLDTIANLSITGTTLVLKRSELAALLRGTGALGDTATSFVAQVGPTMVDLVRVSRPILELLNKYSPEIACTVTTATKAVARLEASFADGPYLKAKFFLQVSRGRYVHGKDDPADVDLSGYGPYCPITPAGDTGTVPPPILPAPLANLAGTASPLNNLLPEAPLALGSTDSPPSTKGSAAVGSSQSGTGVANLVQMLIGPVLG